MYEQDQWQRESDNERKLIDMKIKAGKENDVITFNSINLYQRNGNDVTLLVKEIKRLYDKANRLHEVQSIISEMYADYNMYAEQGDNESCEILGKFIKKLNLATE